MYWCTDHLIFSCDLDILGYLRKLNFRYGCNLPFFNLRDKDNMIYLEGLTFLKKFRKANLL